jgi:hypothetical protein
VSAAAEPEVPTSEPEVPGSDGAPVEPRRANPVWTWLVPLVGSLAVFSGVLLTTPPGFGAITDTIFGQPRGANAEAAAYAIGAAASLALAVLVLLVVACKAIEMLLQHLPRTNHSAETTSLLESGRHDHRRSHA